MIYKLEMVRDQLEVYLNERWKTFNKRQTEGETEHQVVDQLS
jgi:hypothetical protein